jgi:hypothetical protein
MADVRYGEIRGSADDLAAFEDEPARAPAPAPARRIELEPGKVERGLTQLVMSVLEFVRRLLEKQALRRIEGGSLSPQQVEDLGTTLMCVEQKIQELKAQFGLDDLNLDLGPLGDLFDDNDRPGGAQWIANDRS